MNRAQTEYAVSRVAELKDSAKRGLSAKYTSPEIKPSKLERAELIRSGKVSLKAGEIQISEYTNVVDVFDFSAYGREKTFDKDAFTKAFAPIESEATRITDELMLGDAKSALVAIKAFSKICGE